MTLKNVFLFPVLWLSGKEAGTQRLPASLSVGVAGTPGDSPARSPGKHRPSPCWGSWTSLLSMWGDGSSPSSASWHRRQRAAFPPGRARLSASSSGTASQLPGARGGRGGGGPAGNAGCWAGEEHVSARPSVADRPLEGEGGC